MSVSNTHNPAVAQALTAFCTKADAAVAVAEKAAMRTNQLVHALPAGTPAPNELNLFGYCADASLQFALEGDDPQAHAQHLLALYKPLPLIDLRSRGTQTQKPRKYLRTEEQDAARLGGLRTIYPVVFTSGQGLAPRAKWWTSLGPVVGDVCITVVGAQPAHFGLTTEDWQAEAHSYATGSSLYFRPELAVQELKAPALHEWIWSWETFGQEQGFTPQQMWFVRQVRDLVFQDEQLPAATTLPRPNLIFHANAMAPSASAERTVMDLPVGTERARITRQEGAQLNWEGIHTAADCFRQDEIDALWRWAITAMGSLPLAVATQQKQVEGLRQAVQDLLRPHGFTNATPELQRLVSWWLREASGLECAASLLRCERTGWRVRVGVPCAVRAEHLPAHTRFVDVSVPLGDGPALSETARPVRYRRELPAAN